MGLVVLDAQGAVLYKEVIVFDAEIFKSKTVNLEKIFHYVIIYSYKL